MIVFLIFLKLILEKKKSGDNKNLKDSMQRVRYTQVKGFPVVYKGAQLLSGRVLDSRARGRGFEPHRRHCVVSLGKTH